MSDRKLCVALLTSADSWYVDYVERLSQVLAEKSCDVSLLHTHRDLDLSHEICFILSYFKVIPSDVLEQRQYNMVVHESDLPQGRGWAPLFWQVISGKNEIPFTMFNADEGVDSGSLYLKKVLTLNGTELHDELREKQADLTGKMVVEFVERYRTGSLIPMPQNGESSVWPKRTPADSELDVNKTIAEQFDLLRTVNNRDFPAFFTYRGERYTMRITKKGRDKHEDR